MSDAFIALCSFNDSPSLPAAYFNYHHPTDSSYIVHKTRLLVQKHRTLLQVKEGCCKAELLQACGWLACYTTTRLLVEKNMGYKHDGVVIEIPHGLIGHEFIRQAIYRDSKIATSSTRSKDHVDFLDIAIDVQTENTYEIHAVVNTLVMETMVMVNLYHTESAGILTKRLDALFYQLFKHMTK